MILLGLSAVKELFIASRFKVELLRSWLLSHHNVLLKMEKNASCLWSRITSTLHLFLENSGPQYSEDFVTLQIP